MSSRSFVWPPVLLSAILLACSGSGSTGSQPTPPPAPGSLTVTVTDTPEPDSAPLTLKDAQGQSRTLTSAGGFAHLDGLPPGSYTLEAGPELVNDVQTYNPVTSSQTVVITSGQSTTATVTYSPGALLPHGTLTVQVSGLSAGNLALAGYACTTPSFTHVHLLAVGSTGTSFPAVPGTYTFSVCSVDNLQGTPTPATVVVTENQEAVVQYTFEP